MVLGMDRWPSAALVRVRWPDGTLQCELNVPADQVLAVVEHNRKTRSCPVLFAWDGTRFACLGDFLGGGGLVTWSPRASPAGPTATRLSRSRRGGSRPSPGDIGWSSRSRWTRSPISIN